jgi:hypothetical protein
MIVAADEPSSGIDDQQVAGNGHDDVACRRRHYRQYAGVDAVPHVAQPGYVGPRCCRSLKRGGR